MAKCRECKNTYSPHFWDTARICPQCKEKELPFKAILSETTPSLFITPALISINSLVFIVMVHQGVSFMNPTAKDLAVWGGNFGPFIASQWWRLLTCCFVHGGFLHLLVNMWCLWELGRLAERMFGNLTFLMLYILSGLGGSIVSVWWHPNVVSVGASGAVFGVAGGLVAFFYLGNFRVPSVVIRRNLNNVFCFVAYNISNGFGEAGIDNAAHIGGLLIGLVFGSLLHRPLPRPETHPRLSHFILLAGLSLSLILTAHLVRTSVPDNPLTSVLNAERLLQSGDFDKAITECTKAIELDPNLTPAYYNRGNAYFRKAQYDQAISDLSKVIEISPKYAEAYASRAGAYLRKGEYDQAISDCAKAIEMDPKLDIAYLNLGAAHGARREYDKAASNLNMAIKINPREFRAYWIRGNVSMDRREYDEAVSDFEMVIEMTPNFAEAYCSKGTANERRARFDSAMSDYSKAIEIKPQLIEAYINRGTLLMKLGDRRKACADYKKACELGDCLFYELTKREGTCQ